MPYEPNLTHTFAVPYVCFYHVYAPAVHSCPNELYNIHCNMHATSKVIVQSEYEPYLSNGDTFDINLIPIIQTTLRTKRTVRDPEQSEKLPFHLGYKNCRITISLLHFLITIKKGIQVDQRNRNGWYGSRCWSSISQFASCVSHQFSMLCKDSFVKPIDQTGDLYPSSL